MKLYFVVGIFECLIRLTPYAADFVCRDGWIQERNKCYRVFNNTVTWQQAKTGCDIIDAELLVLNDLTEQTFILHLRPISIDIDYWIGYYKINQTWRWVKTPNTSINQLDTTNITTGDDCATITKIGVWLPTKCDNKLPYLCTAKPISCDISLGWFVYGTQCLYVVNGNYRWEEARHICYSFGADLGSFPGVILDKLQLINHKVMSPVWVGVSYTGNNALWVNGVTEISTTSGMNTRHCGYLDVGTAGNQSLIKQTLCGNTMSALCEKVPHIPINNMVTTNVISTKGSIMFTKPQSLYGTTNTLYENFQLQTCLFSTTFYFDCVKELFEVNSGICDFSKSLRYGFNANITTHLDDSFYQELVSYVGNMIEANLTFSLCEQKSTEVFVVMEQVLDVIIPFSNILNTSLNLHTGQMEMGFNYRRLTQNVLFESMNYGCMVTDVKIPTVTATKSEETIIFVVINNDRPLQVAFADRKHMFYYFLVSSVVMITAYDKSGHKLNAAPSFTLYYHDIQTTITRMRLNVSGTEIVCAYFDVGVTSWAQTGCTTLDVGTFTVTCRCNHTTSFGIIMKVKAFEREELHEVTLSIITYIGCGISLVTLFIALTIFTCIRSLNSERVFVHRNLCIAILASQVVFLAGSKALKQSIVCRVTALILHYCFLSIFTWMLVEGLHLYTKVVQVFGNEKSRSLYYLCFGWGVPLCMVVISAVADWEGYGTDTSCWLSIDRHTIWAFIGPAIAVVIVNFIILVIVLRIVVTSAKHERTSKSTQIRAAVKATLFLLHILGLTWIFGILAVNRQTIVFEYLFAICNSLQGFFVFLFHCILNTEVRQALHRVRERHSSPISSTSSSSESENQSSSTLAIHGTLRFRLEYVGDVRMNGPESGNECKHDIKGIKRTKSVKTTNTKQTVVSSEGRKTGNIKDPEDLSLVYI